MIHVDDNDSNDSNTELKELLIEFQSLFGALEIEEDTNTIDILDEDLILTSGITDLCLAHQSNRQEKENRTTKKHIRDDESSDEIQGSNKRVCNQGNRSLNMCLVSSSFPRPFQDLLHSRYALVSSSAGI